MLWCWRCRIEMPMLDEQEYAIVHQLYGSGMMATKRFRDDWGIPLDNRTKELRFQPLLNMYEQMTGYIETNPNAVMHHRLALYGPPCKHCGKPLRTPKAKLCASCMHPRCEE
jgi:hypothetical protein